MKTINTEPFKEAIKLKKKKKVLMVRMDAEILAAVNRERKRNKISWEKLLTSLLIRKKRH